MSSYAFIQFSAVLLSLMAPLAHCHVLPEYFEVGVLYPIVTDTHEPHEMGQKSIAAIKLAFEHINNKADGVADNLLPDVQLRMVARSPLSSFASGAMDAVDMLQARGGDGFMACVGPVNIDSIRGMAPVMAEHDVPVVGYSQRASRLGNSVNFPNFLNTVPNFYMDAHAAADIVREYFQWSKVTVLYSDDNRQYGSGSAFLFSELAKNLGIEILSSHAVIPGEEEQALKSAKAFGARIFVLFFHAEDAVPLLRLGHEKGVFGKHRQIIGGDHMSRMENWTPLGLSSAELNLLLHGFVGARWEEHVDRTTQLYQDFMQGWFSLPSTLGVEQPDDSIACDETMDYYNEFYLHQFFEDEERLTTPICSGLNYSSYAEADITEVFPAYDAVFAVARGMHALLYGQAEDDMTPKMLHDYMLNDLEFEGLTGLLQFDRENEDLEFNVGGRSGHVTFRVVNYAYTAEQPDVAGALSPKMLWTLEDGIAEECDHDDSCHEFMFNTGGHGRTQPTDGPEPEIVYYPNSLRVVVYILAAINIALIMYYEACLLAFRTRRFVKITQPQLTHLVLLGASMMVINAALMTENLTPEVCSASQWLDDLGFVSVFLVLGLKLWRVDAISSAMTKKIVTVRDVAVRFAIGMFVMVILLVTAQGLGITVEESTTLHDQFDYEKQQQCHTDDGVYTVILTFEYLILVGGLYYCRRTRNIDSSLSNVSNVTNAIITATAALVLVEVLDAAASLEPILMMFVKELVVLLLVLRVTWVLYFEFCLKLLLGTDLDRSLKETTTSWSIRELPLIGGAIQLLLPSSGSVSTKATHMGEEAMNKKLKKFAKLKNAEELESEIKIIRGKLMDLKDDLTCLENMRYSHDLSQDRSSVTSSAPNGRVVSSSNHSIGPIPQFPSKNKPVPVVEDQPSFGSNSTVLQAFSSLNTRFVAVAEVDEAAYVSEKGAAVMGSEEENVVREV